MLKGLKMLIKLGIVLVLLFHLFTEKRIDSLDKEPSIPTDRTTEIQK